MPVEIAHGLDLILTDELTGKLFQSVEQAASKERSPRHGDLLAEVISDPQHVAIMRYLVHERQPTDKEVFPSLVRHCRTHCRSLFVTHL